MDLLEATVKVIDKEASDPSLITLPKKYMNVSGSAITPSEYEFSLSDNLVEKGFISSHPSGAICLFEDRLRKLKKDNKPTEEYIEKLVDLKKKLDTLIIEWV